MTGKGGANATVPGVVSERRQPRLPDPFNAAIARRLDEVASVLGQQQAGPFRVRAYRGAAAAVRDLPVPVATLLNDEGVEGLERIPGVGPRIARAIAELVRTGHLQMLRRLEGEADPVQLFATLPGIGPRLAERLHAELGLSSLEDLEVAAHDGRLDALPGFGAKRVAGVVSALAQRLERTRARPAPEEAPPSVAEILDVDRQYREGAEAHRLPTIAPRRFNPERRPWLPILHTSRGVRHYTALFSNTAMAHRLGRTHDWVVIYGDGERDEHQATVVTVRTGPLAGRRVVRGRESECLDFYRER
ncbi:MAG TPA: helix-hairpin-helix domain-containing protein [Gemmatimonadales bacterium]|nr:helix-hairpin-helix domain-containing protein [Gemmatimonadales bacterium]